MEPKPFQRSPHLIAVTEEWTPGQECAATFTVNDPLDVWT